MLNKSAISPINLIILSTLMMILSLLAPTAHAGGMDGRSPFTAIPIKSNQASGMLLPSEEEWRQFTPTGNTEMLERQMNAALVFSSDDRNQTGSVTLEVYSTDQLDLWYSDNTRKPQSINPATAVTHDNNPATRELLWSGKVTPNQTSYVRIANETDFAVDYTLSVDLEAPAEARAVSGSATLSESAVSLPTEVSSPTIDLAVETVVDAYPTQPIAVTLAPQQVTVKEGQLPAGEDRWFSLNLSEMDGHGRQPLNLTLFFTPNDGNNIHKVHMDIFPGNYSAHWLADHTTPMQNFGAGMIVSRDGEPLTGEIIWDGVLNNGDTYYVRLRNDNSTSIDYRLFTGNIVNTELGKPTPSPLPAVNVAPGTDPNYAMPLAMDLNKGHLKPAEERWYLVKVTDLDGKTLESLKLSLYFTPNNGHNLHQVHFDIFAAGSNHIWTRGDTGQMPNLGAGSLVARDNNPETGELFWDGWLVDGDTYNIRVRNSSDSPIDYWLFTGDIQGAELGR